MLYHQNELFPNLVYDKVYIKKQIEHLWNLPGIGTITPDERNEYKKIVNGLTKLSQKGATLNLHYFFNCIEQVIKDPLMIVSETHFISTIYLCVPLKNRTNDENSYFRELEYFYVTWVNLLKKKHSIYISQNL